MRERNYQERNKKFFKKYVDKENKMCYYSFCRQMRRQANKGKDVNIVL